MPKNRVPAWAVRWRSRIMSAPAFWYYATKRRARQEAMSLLDQGCEVLIYKAELPIHNAHIIAQSTTINKYANEYCKKNGIES